jgi:P-type conjugative transfer protein TrbJ
MKRLYYAAMTALLLMPPTRSDAVVVECANCSTIAEELLSDAKQANQYTTQLDQYRTQLQQYQNMLTNTMQLPMSIWNNVTSDIMQIRNLTNAASLLTGNSGTIMSRLQNAQGYASSATMLPNQISNQFTMWQQTLGNASNSLGRTLGVQQGQENNNAALQARIQAQSTSAVGQMQAIQAGNQLAALTSSQLNQIQTTLTAAAQEQATRDQIAADRQAMQDAQWQAFVAAPALNTSGYPSY